uniref:Uncharacterized protein n=1 Tax=Opuntia streptacantha TaxID=393608 RepID=A0A7C9CRA4_OPUST
MPGTRRKTVKDRNFNYLCRGRRLRVQNRQKVNTTWLLPEGCLELRAKEGQHLVVDVEEGKFVAILCRKEIGNVRFVNGTTDPCMSGIVVDMRDGRYGKRNREST